MHSEHIQIGTLINGKYELIEQLGSGGMGRVFKAQQVGLGRMVAVKIVHGALVQSAKVLERFQQEAQLAASLRHHHICEVTELGRHETGEPYLVMPLLEGATLGELIHRKRHLSVHRVCDIVSQTLRALQVAHERRIVHRDLKPDNIFITTMGDRANFVKLLDFGISKVLDQDSVLELTRTGAVVGTPYYMSPEQARGETDIDHRTDLYAMGVILYEALTGCRPFEADSYNRVMYQIQTTAFPAPSHHREDIPPEIERVVLRAMERDPAARYESAAAMEERLQEVLAELATDDDRHIPITAGPDTLMESPPLTPTDAGTQRTNTPVSFVGFSIDDSADSWPPASPARSRSKSTAYAVAFAVVLVGSAMLTVSRLSPAEETRAAHDAIEAVEHPAPAPHDPSTVGSNPQALIAPAENRPVGADNVVANPPPTQKKRRRSKSDARRKNIAARSHKASDAEAPAPQAKKPHTTPTAKRLTGRLGARIVVDYED